MAAQVFISYSSKDRTVANMVCALLEARGHRCWIAPRDIVPGREWGEAIVDGIKGARVFVLIFSAHANQSPQILREVERAVNRGMPIIPFRIEDVVPEGSLEYFMSVPHWLDALAPPVEQHVARLGDVIDQLDHDGSARAAGTGTGQRAAWTQRPMLRAGVGGALLALSGGAVMLADAGPTATAMGWAAVALAALWPALMVVAGMGWLWQRRALRLALTAVTVAAAALFLWASASFVIDGAHGARLTRGWTCTADAALVYADACPALPAEALADAAFEPALLWTPASIGGARQLLAGSWAAMLLAAATLIGAWCAPRFGRAAARDEGER